MMSNDGLIIENTDLSHIDLAVPSKHFKDFSYIATKTQSI
jgi:hypothetical protein